MKKIALSLLTLTTCFAVSAQSITKTITVENSSATARTDAPIEISIAEFGADFNVRSATVMTMDGKKIAYQLDDTNGDRRADVLAFVIDIDKRTKKGVSISLLADAPTETFEPRVHAQMLISDRSGKHKKITSLTVKGTENVYNTLHHHGPAFESELVAYRLYFDQKQTVDIYGKFNKGLEIERCGFYPTDEQLAEGFGDDVLRVGGSCGVGALKGWNGEKATHIEPVAERTERIVASGPVRTIVEIVDRDWQYSGKQLNKTARYTLWAGHRDARVDISFDEPLGDEVFATGVQNIKGSTKHSNGRGLVGCWGRDWPVNDTVKYAKETVGLGCYVPAKYVKKEVQDRPNYLYLVGADGKNEFHYYITFTSHKETFGYPTQKQWFAHLDAWSKELEEPVTWSF